MNSKLKELNDFIGDELSGQVHNEITKINDGVAFRIIRPASCHTCDYKPLRLNVSVDSDNVIQGFSFG